MLWRCRDHLGTQHDLHVAATLAREMAERKPDLSKHELASIDRFAHQLDDGVVRLGRSLGRTWRPLVAPEHRRRLGRGLARL